MKCLKCGFDAPDTMKYCGMCGSVLVKLCASCQAENPLTYRYCGMCGAPFAETEEPAMTSLTEVTLPVAAREEDEVAVEPLLLEGERKVVTVVITDVVSSTRLLELLGNEGWVELMNRILNIQEEQVLRFGGTVDQFRGDGMVAFFGAEEAHEDDPERAILASFAILQSIQSLEQSLNHSSQISLKLRIGINTGEVIIGSHRGKRQHQEEIAMGVGVTIAARLEALAEPGTILVSENTYRLTEGQFEWLPMGEVTVSGLGRPLTIYRPVSLKEVIEPKLLWMGVDFSVPVIGKEKEFAIMKQAVKDLALGRGGIVLVSAETGMGKSFIINRLRQYFAHREDLLAHLSMDQKIQTPVFYRGRCRSFSNTWAYSMWIDLLHDWLGVHKGASGKKEVRNALILRSRELWGDQFVQYYPYLASLLSVLLEEEFTERIRYLDAVGLSEQYRWTLEGWVEAVALQGPAVIIFTDIQWADTPSLEVLKRCFPFAEGIYSQEVGANGRLSLRRYPILWLLSMRPDRDSPAWELRYFLETNYPHRLTTITLSQLDQQQGEHFLNTLLGPGVLPEQTMRLIIKNAEGNPYYMEEYVRSLVESGLLVQEYETGKWKLTREITSLEIPANLQQLFQARIDQLPFETRLVLQMAAVIGPIFWFNVLQHLISDSFGPHFSLAESLARLMRENLIRERNQVPILGMEYVFSSGLVRETAYESLLATQRTNAHLRVASFLEGQTGLENDRQYDGLIAYHYGRGGNIRKELFFTLQAAETARQVYANAEALGHCNRALEIIEALEDQAADEGQKYALSTQKFDALKMRQTLHYILGDVEAGDRDGRALLPLAEQMADDPAWMIDALLMQPEVNRLDNRQDLPIGLEMARRALSLAQQMGDRHRELYSLLAVARISFLMGDRGAIEIGYQAFEIAKELGDARTQIDLLLALRNVYGMDDIQTAERYLDEALKIAEKNQDKLIELRLLAAMGDRLEREGDYYRLLTQIHQKRLQISREIGYRLEEGFAQMYCAQIQGLYLGDYTTALTAAEESFRMTARLSQSLFPLLRVAQLQTMLGLYSEAQSSLDLAQPYAERGISDIGRAGFWLVQAILCNRIGDEAHYKKALEACEKVWKLGDQGLVSRQYIMTASCEASAAYLGLANLTVRSEEKQYYLNRALETSTGASDIFRQFGFVQVIECTSEEILYRHSLALAANHRTEEARQELERAYQEMMRKYQLIPPGSPFRKTFLENISLHRDLRLNYEKMVKPRRRRKATQIEQSPAVTLEGKSPAQ